VPHGTARSSAAAWPAPPTRPLETLLVVRA